MTTGLFSVVEVSREKFISFIGAMYGEILEIDPSIKLLIVQKIFELLLVLMYPDKRTKFSR